MLVKRPLKNYVGNYMTMHADKCKDRFWKQRFWKQQCLRKRSCPILYGKSMISYQICLLDSKTRNYLYPIFLKNAKVLKAVN